VFKTNFLSTTKVGALQKRFGGDYLRMAPVSTGLGRTVARTSSIEGLYVCAEGTDTVQFVLVHNMNSTCRLCKLII